MADENVALQLYFQVYSNRIILIFYISQYNCCFSIFDQINAGKRLLSKT